MITRDTDAFVRFARELETIAPACPKAVFLVASEGFSLAAESASDNAYMDLERAVDGERALRQHRRLQRALAETLPAIAPKEAPTTSSGPRLQVLNLEPARFR